MAGWTSAHWLHRLNQPTLVSAGGGDDPLVRASSHIGSPRTRLHVVAGGGYLFVLDQPHDVVNVVSAFLAKEQT
jgi:pimeloyl-ACP methyl ester carboxylesterase